MDADCKQTCNLCKISNTILCSGLACTAFIAIRSGLVARGRLSRSLIRLLWPCTGHHARYSAANGHVR